jgi:hypothetical protein
VGATTITNFTLLVPNQNEYGSPSYDNGFGIYTTAIDTSYITAPYTSSVEISYQPIQSLVNYSRTTNTFAGTINGAITIKLILSGISNSSIAEGVLINVDGTSNLITTTVSAGPDFSARADIEPTIIVVGTMVYLPTVKLTLFYQGNQVYSGDMITPESLEVPTTLPTDKANIGSYIVDNKIESGIIIRASFQEYNPSKRVIGYLENKPSADVRATVGSKSGALYTIIQGSTGNKLYSDIRPSDQYLTMNITNLGAACFFDDHPTTNEYQIINFDGVNLYFIIGNNYYHVGGSDVDNGQIFPPPSYALAKPVDGFTIFKNFVNKTVI